MANTNESFQGINSDGNFVFVSGYATNQNGSANSLYVMKLDTAGNISWDYVFNYPFNSTSDAVIPLPGGDIIASGDKLLGGGIYTNFIVRIDSGGNYVWDFDLNQYNSGCKNDFMSASGDIYIVGESATSGNFLFDPTVTRIDTAHNIQWSNTYPGAVNATDAAMDMIEPLPENFLVTGYGVNPANNSADIFLMRIHSSGTEINRSYFGDTTFDIAYSLIRANGNAGCYITGSTDRNGHNQGYLIYTGLMGIPTSIKDQTDTGQFYIVSPNPCNDILTIVRKNSGLQNIYISLTDATGKYLIKDKTINNEKIFNLPIGQVASGLYILNIRGE